jgi:hypothetical protein
MTKTEAAEILALDVRVWARQHAAPIDKDLVEARLSESKHLGGLKATAGAVAPSWRTILRLAREEA